MDQKEREIKEEPSILIDDEDDVDEVPPPLIDDEDCDMEQYQPEPQPELSYEVDDTELGKAVALEWAGEIEQAGGSIDGRPSPAFSRMVSVNDPSAFLPKPGTHVNRKMKQGKVRMAVNSFLKLQVLPLLVPLLFCTQSLELSQSHQCIVLSLVPNHTLHTLVC
jgi:hypothetical protein